MTNTQQARLEAIKDRIKDFTTALDIVDECGIIIEEKPSEMPSRAGYKWKPIQTTAGGSITWIEEEDPNAEGTADNPIQFTAGMTIHPNYYYTDGTTRYVCIQAGNPTELGEGEYFTEF